MVKQMGLSRSIKIAGLFLVLFHLLVHKADYSSFSTTLLNTFYTSTTDSHHGCNKIYLEESNKTPIKCNTNYCNNFSSLFTASFSSFAFNKLMGKETKDPFFLYDDPPYSSFFNAIWIPPKITI